VLSLLGASFEAKNKEGKSVHEELMKMLDNDNKNFNEIFKVLKLSKKTKISGEVSISLF
jgi:hypothetical protein